MASTVFWIDQAQVLFRLILPVYQDAAVKAAALETENLISNFGVLLDREFINEAALALAETMTYDLVSGMTATTQTMLADSAAAWIASGEPLDNFIESLVPIFGETRAESIGVTEITRVFAQANTETWRNSGVISKRKFNTVNDDRVCPICAPLDGEIVDIGAVFSGGVDNPPAHPRCRCWVTPVV